MSKLLKNGMYIEDEQIECIINFVNKANLEEEVINFFNKDPRVCKLNLWDESLWVPFNNDETNMRMIGSQTKSPLKAIGEKITNCVDATMTGTLKANGIDPESKEAPQSIEEYNAIYNKEIGHGALSDIDPSKAKKIFGELANRSGIQVELSGEKQQINYTFIDHGEGQTPKSIVNTMLSFSTSNKDKIGCVQGAFNMGGTAALKHFNSGAKRLQVITTRKNPNIPDRLLNNDETKNEWAFTILRYFPAKSGSKSGCFKYLAPCVNDIGGILGVETDSFKLATKVVNDTTVYQNEEPMEYGTAVKLFNYSKVSIAKEIRRPITDNSSFGLNLAVIIPKLLLPIKLIDCRKSMIKHNIDEGVFGKKEDTNSNNRGYRLACNHYGMYDKLNTISRYNGTVIATDEFLIRNIEDPEYKTKYNLPVKVFLLDDNKKKNCAPEDTGVVYLYKTQSQHFLKKSIFNKCNLSLLENNILVIVDFSKISNSLRDIIFSTDRDGVNEGITAVKICDEIKKALETNVMLQNEQKKRKERIFNGNNNNEATKSKMLEQFSKNPMFKEMFYNEKVVRRVNRNNDDEDDITGINNSDEINFIPSINPTVLKLKYCRKEVELNKKVVAKFETDARDDYFSELDQFNTPLHYKVYRVREDEETDITGKLEGVSFNSKSGIAALSFTTPIDKMKGEYLNASFRVAMLDELGNEVASDEFTVKIVRKLNNANKGLERKTTGDGSEGKEKEVSFINGRIGQILPEQEKDRLISFGFDDTKKEIVVVKEIDKKYNIMVNLSNEILKEGLKDLKDVEKANTMRNDFFNHIVLNIITAIKILEERNKNIEKNNSDNVEQNETIDIVNQIIMNSEIIAKAFVMSYTK